MSRSVVVGWVVAVVLLAGVIAVDGYWGWLARFSSLEKAIIVGCELLGVALAAVSVRRIVDPTLKIPPLFYVLYVIGAVFYLISLFTRKDTDDKTDTTNNNNSSSSFDDSKGMGRGWAIVAMIGGLVVYGIGVGVPFMLVKHPIAKAATTTKPTAHAVAEAPAPSVAASVQAAPPDIVDAADLAAAIAFARPALTDTRDAPSPGAKQLARYAAAKLRWADVAVKDETSPALVEKDPLAAMGKRLCAAGVLLRIEKQTVDGVELYTARMVTRKGDVLEMFVVGPTGALVKRSAAKFCGIVAGRLDSGGKPATFAVGMFEPAKR